jgi:AsmA family/AsmA-like C-terminal region
VNFSSSKRRLVVAVVVVILALFLVRPGASRLKGRIITSLSRAVGRPVDIGSVHLRFLPRPGFDLENIVVYEDPAFGAEPMLRASEVTAVIRLTSLVRGRVDVARLELIEPSLNLVCRKEDGRWNWESLLERTAHSPLAPTAKAKLEPRPGFPYIEASSGRINFKMGPEKKPYALLNADFAVWQESENNWGVRLTAEPLRTDMSLSDTGLLRVNGTWQRAGNLHETPLQLAVEWNRGQLGQLTKLVSGNDKGWRGDVRVAMTLSGTPNALQVATDVSIENFRRYDIPASDALRLAAHCDGKYSSADGMVREILCSAPVGVGMVTLHGEAGRPRVRTLDLNVNLENVPVSSVAQLARRVKKNLPVDLTANGNVQGNISVKEDSSSADGAQFQGHGEVMNFRLGSVSGKAEFAPGRVPFLVSSVAGNIGQNLRGRRDRQVNTDLFAPNEFHIEYGPFQVGLGRPAAVQARGWIVRSGYAIAVKGDAEISHALRVANLLGLPAIKANVEGIAQFDLQIAGSWSESASATPSAFPLPLVTGTAQMRDVRASVRGLTEPLEISSGELRLLPDEVRVEKLNALAAGAQWTGFVAMPRGCGTPGACEVRFNLNTNELAMAGLYQWLTPNSNERSWYQVLTSSSSGTPPLLQNLRASGSINVTRLMARNLTMGHVIAEIDLDRGKLKASNLRSDFLDGAHHGDWQADFTGPTPLYSGSGTLTNVSLDQAADAMHDAWISGTATVVYRLTANGAGLAAFWQSADAELQVDLRDATLPHISLTNDGSPLQIVRWKSVAHLRNRRIELEKSKLAGSTGRYEVSGSISLGQALDLELVSAAPPKSNESNATYSITGTLAAPRVVLTPAPETQAQLKSQ